MCAAVVPDTYDGFRAGQPHIWISGIKPLLAGVVRTMGRPPKNPNPLDKHYVALREELHRTFETIGLAA